jgi:hypothetical protein
MNPITDQKLFVKLQMINGVPSRSARAVLPSMSLDVQRNATYTESQNKPAGCRQAKLIVQDFVHPKEPVIQLLCPHFQSWSLIRKPDLQADDSPEWT